MGEEIDRNSSSKTNQNNSFVIDARDHGELPMLEITVQIIIMLLGILGNGFILGAIARRRKVWPLSRVHICMFHLCLADLFVIIFNILPHVMRKVLLNFQGSDFFCRCVKFAEIFTLYLSVYILVSIAIDRFLAFQTSKGWNALKIIKVLNGVTWMISGLFAAPQTIFFLLTEVYPGRFDCRASFTVTWGITTYVIFFAVTLFGFPLMVIFVCYVKICKDIRNHYSSDITFLRKPSRRRSDFSERSFHLDAKDKHNRLNNGDDKFKRRERQVVNKRRSQLTYAKVKSVKLTLVIIISFFVCWVPFCTVQVLKLYNTDTKMTPEHTIFLLLASLNSCINPLIYLVFSETLLNQLRKWCGISLYDTSNSNTDENNEHDEINLDQKLPSTKICCPCPKSDLQ